MSRVYITNDPGLDFSKAEAFGELVRLTSGPINIFRPEKVQEEIEDGLVQFKYQTDYLLVAGATLAAAFAAAHIATMPVVLPAGERVPVRFLVFDVKKREYIVRTIGI